MIEIFRSRPLLHQGVPTHGSRPLYICAHTFHNTPVLFLKCSQWVTANSKHSLAEHSCTKSCKALQPSSHIKGAITVAGQLQRPSWRQALQNNTSATQVIVIQSVLQNSWLEEWGSSAVFTIRVALLNIQLQFVMIIILLTPYYLLLPPGARWWWNLLYIALGDTSRFQLVASMAFRFHYSCRVNWTLLLWTPMIT